MIGTSQSSLRFIKLQRRSTKTKAITGSPTNSSLSSPTASAGTQTSAHELASPVVESNNNNNNNNQVVFVDVSHPRRGAVYPPPSEGVLRAIEASERFAASPAPPATPTTHTPPPTDVDDTSATGEKALSLFGRRVPKALQLYKVALCAAWSASQKNKSTTEQQQQHEECPFGSNCAFAHGPNEQRSRLINVQFVRKLRTKGRERASVDPSRYKVRMCDSYVSGGTAACEYGENCMYAHGVHELRSISTNSEAEARLKQLLLARHGGSGAATSTARRPEAKAALSSSSSSSSCSSQSSCA
eukprot:PhM_4_TR13715/c1_g1_i1/m.29236